MRTTLITAALLFALTAPAPAAQAQSSTGAFIVLLGNDTVGVERFSRTGNRLEGEILNRVPRTARMRYVAELEGDGRLSSFELTRFASPESDSVAQRITMRFGQDSVVTESRTGEAVQRQAVATSAHTLPWVGSSYATHELAVQRARAARRDSIAVPFLSPGAAQPSTLEVHRHAGDSLLMRIVLAGGVIEHEGRTDGQGRILELRGIGGSYGSNVRRAERVDMAALRRDFTARDRDGRGLGQLSPRDTSRAQVGGATIEIDYSRPSARGRTIMGGLLTEGEVWRLGANQATHLSTDRDLVFGDAVVPAGRYTLFAEPGAERWMLIVNRQTGQWGTEHDAAQDLVRIPLAVSRATPPREQLTVDVEPSAQGGTLRVSWGEVLATAPFRVR
jgi:hypothetical protein